MPSKKLIQNAIIGGVPTSTSNLLFDVSQILIDRLITSYGDIPMAAIGIVLKAERIPLNAGIGICQGMMPLIAYNYAAKNHTRMKKVLLAGLCIAALAIVLYEFCVPQILHLFINDPHTETLGAAFLRARCLATPFMFMCFHILYFFQGMGKAKTAFWLAVIRQLILYMPLLILMNTAWGIYGLVWTQLVSDAIMTILSFAAYFQFEKKEMQI